MLVNKPLTSFESVNAMMIESFSAKAVMSAVELKIFDHTEGKKLNAADLADKLGLVAERLEPLLDILVAAELLTQSEGLYMNTPTASEFLLSESPFYQGDSMALTMHFNAMVEDSITNLVSGGKIDRAKTDKDWSTNRSMEGTAQDAIGGALPHVVELVSGLPNFDEFRTMCDIGGNHGMYTLGILEKNEQMHGTIFDLPHVAKQARARCDRLGFSDRVTTHGLDFREDRLPAEQFDLAVTSHVLYAFTEDLSNALTKIAEGLKPGGWFVSHHYSKTEQKGKEMTVASLELLTRLCGYSSHYIEKEKLISILDSLGFEDILCQPVSASGLGLIIAARKKGSD